jgi:hypothetical protein
MQNDHRVRNGINKITVSNDPHSKTTASQVWVGVIGAR